MNNMPPDRYPDAAMVPYPFRRLVDPHALLKQLFLPLFDPKKVHPNPAGQPGIYTRTLNTEAMYFISPDPTDTIHFGTGHPLQSVARYDWFVLADNDTDRFGTPRPVARYNVEPRAVKLGWLRDEAALLPEVLGDPSKHADEYASQMGQYLPRAKRFQELLGVPADTLTGDQRAELDRLQAMFKHNP